MPGGVRLHAVLAPIARPGPTISLRIPGAQILSLHDLVGLGALPEWCAAALRRLVTARVAYVISGGTGSGKTTLLSALLAECPVDERLVLVEDSSELRHHPRKFGERRARAFRSAGRGCGNVAAGGAQSTGRGPAGGGSPGS